MKHIVMIGTHFDTMGGISSVVNVYRSSGLFGRVPIIYIPTHCDGSFFSKAVIASKAFCRYMILLLTGRIGLLHVHVSSRSSFWRKSLFVLPAFLGGVDVILHLHSGRFHDFYEKDCGRLRKIFVRFLFDNATRVIVLSNGWKTWLQSISTNRQIRSIYNPVLLPSLVQWDSRKKGVVLCLGRLGRNKGSYDLLQAIRNIENGQALVHLVLGGDGDIEGVRGYAISLGLAPQVELLGWIKGQAKDRQLASANIYALPSYHEGLPMSVLEAMAAGMPIVSTFVGGIPEAVTDGIEGFLVNPGDVDALADRLRRLLEDPALAQRMGAAARRKVEATFSSDAILPKIEEIYAELGFKPS